MTLLAHWEGEPVRVWSDLWRVPRLDVHDVVGSTNDELRALARRGCPPFTVVVAEEQTAGRGRSGSSWLAAPGASLLCSILLPVPADALPNHLALVVGLAAARAMEAVSPGLQAGIKWPNDVYLDQRKCCGILCEVAPSGVVAGVGINVRSAFDTFPDDLRDRVTSVEDAAGARVSRAELGGRLISELRGLAGVDGSFAWSADVRRQLSERDILAGRGVETRLGTGLARGIGPDGALLVETGGTVKSVVAGGVRLV